MPGFNAQTYLEEFVSAATQRELNRTDADNISSTEISRRLNTALTFLHNLYKPTRVRRSEDLVEGEQSVRFPYGRLNQAITQVWIIREDGTQYQLERIDEDVMESLYPIATTENDSGEPAFWCFSNGLNIQSIRNTIRIRPVPTYDLTDGVVFRYPSFPEQLYRVENVSTKLAEFTFASEFAWIYGTGGGNGNSIARFGDEIGICESTNYDGTTTEDATVRVWYQIVEKASPLTGSILTDLVTNGTFTGAATGWTLGGGAAYNANNVTFTGAGTLAQTLTVTATNWYRVDYTLSSSASGSITPTFAGAAIYGPDSETARANQSTNGAKYGYFLATGSSGSLLFTNASGDITIDTVSVSAVTRLELERVFFQETDAAARYISAQVPDIEYSVPGGIGFAPVHLALSDYFDNMNQPRKAAIFRDKGMAVTLKFNRDEPGDQFDRYNPYLGLEQQTALSTVTYWADNSASGYVPYWARGILPGNPTLTN